MLMLDAFLYQGEARTLAVTAAAVELEVSSLRDAKRNNNALSLAISAGETPLSLNVVARRRAFLAA